MTTIDNKNISSCWSKIKRGKGSNYFIEIFYNTMFATHPEIKNLFPESMKKQNASLLNMLDNVINGIEHLDEFEEILIHLGEQHKRLGIEEKMYDVFIEIVVEAAKQASNNTISETELLDWENAFRTVADIMITNY
jgi:hemoglobin-like flavoprotein